MRQRNLPDQRRYLTKNAPSLFSFDGPIYTPPPPSPPRPLPLPNHIFLSQAGVTRVYCSRLKTFGNVALLPIAASPVTHRGVIGMYVSVVAKLQKTRRYYWSRRYYISYLIDLLESSYLIGFNWFNWISWFGRFNRFIWVTWVSWVSWINRFNWFRRLSRITLANRINRLNRCSCFNLYGGM